MAFALQRDRRQAAPDDFREQLDELLKYLGNGTSFRFESPEIWLLGSSQDSAIWAAELGLPYCFADFINPNGAELMRYYRGQTAAPRSAIASWAILRRKRDAEAERLSLSFRMMMTMLYRGRSIPVPTVERAQRFLEEENLLPHQVPAGRRIIAGTPARVREAL